MPQTLQSGETRSHKIVEQRRKSCCGAGEGNRTLVFSLEVVEFRCRPISHSDILQPCGSLRPLQNFFLSEWRWPVKSNSPKGSWVGYVKVEARYPLRISRTDSVPDFFQELNFSRRLITLRQGRAGDSDGEQRDSVGNLGLVGTRGSGPSRCGHAISAGRSISRGICRGMRRSGPRQASSICTI